MGAKIYAWLDSRLRLKPIERALLDEPIPGGSSWIYVFGSATLFLFGLQLITGMFLGLYYVPSPEQAYDSVQYIQRDVWFGWFVRGLHHWGASAVITVVGLHMLQVFLYGAYKPPREAMWIVGVTLLFLMLAFGFTGYLLPWDQNAYWATQVGINMVETIPIVGDMLALVIRGGETLGSLTLSRFFALHVMFLPALILLGIVLHLFVFRRVGPAGPWDEVRAKTQSETFYPRQVFMDAIVMVGIFIILVGLAATVEFPLADRADPSDTSFVPVPEWYFLFYYQLLKYVEGPLIPLATWILPVLLIIGLYVFPFIGNNPNRRPYRRPVALATGGVFLLAVFVLLGISLRDLYAVPHEDPSVAQGKQLYVQYACATCHRIHGEGGAVGPDLSYIGDRQPDRSWHIKHHRNPQSVNPASIMPKFPLSESELYDLSSYMLSLNRDGDSGSSTDALRQKQESYVKRG